MGSTTKSTVLLENTTFNINQTVIVRLTERGKDILLESIRSDTLERLTPSQVERMATRRYVRDETDPGAYSFPLYELMAIFGPELPKVPRMGKEFVLFEDGNDMTLVPSQLHVALHQAGQL